MPKFDKGFIKIALAVVLGLVVYNIASGFFVKTYVNSETGEVVDSFSGLRRVA